jgi:hypothetical protein
MYQKIDKKLIEISGKILLCRRLDWSPRAEPLAAKKNECHIIVRLENLDGQGKCLACTERAPDLPKAIFFKIEPFDFHF